MLAKVDNLTGYIQEQLVDLGLDKRVNVVHLSDHGMHNLIHSNNSIIDLRTFVANGSFEMYGFSPVIQIVPTGGKNENGFEMN